MKQRVSACYGCVFQVWMGRRGPGMIWGGFGSHACFRFASRAVLAASRSKPQVDWGPPKVVVRGFGWFLRVI